LPESSDDLLILRPLGGTDDEVTGIYRPLEAVEPAQFALPDPARLGDHRSSKLLRDAVRLGFRSSAGPFRSFGRIAIEPRPYQLVPLLMALKLDPVRMLIADDVGIGKTVEAALIARELLDRGEVRRLAVLCPPPLAEQWQTELRDKFHIDAELVLPGTATRLERGLGLNESLFDRHPFVIVSTDFIKSDKRRDEFLRTCPEMVIVDEAHTCAWTGQGRTSRHQRHQLVSGLAKHPDRHLILVTATPHSGNENGFRSLLTLLDPGFADLPDNLGGDENRRHRERVAAHLVQRRRGDIESYLDTSTPFPKREDSEATYTLSPEYRALFERVLDYAHEMVNDPATDRRHQRVQWWSVLALLRSLASSPAAAAATLRNRAATLDTETPEEADEIGRRSVMDLVEDESAEAIDLAPGSDAEAADDEVAKNRRRLRDMARAADALRGPMKDLKLKGAIEHVRTLLAGGFRPIVFCRFVPTAEYVAEALRAELSGVEVQAVTGQLTPADREQRVEELGKAERRVLVATDCLSEGINLQEQFDAVVHYDLSWNPTRHEQREGRVDRYGQPSPVVRALTWYGRDNHIDAVVLEVLLRKHKKIRTSLGISVPVPGNTEDLMEAVLSSMLRRKRRADQLTLEFMPEQQQLFADWEASAEREKRSRTLFAQHTIKVEEVRHELEAARAAVGSGADVAEFTREALSAAGASITRNGAIHVDLGEAPRALRDLMPASRFRGRFELPVKPGELHLSRTHPVVESLATWVLDAALDSAPEAIAKRCGIIRTGGVSRRTTLLLLRFRFHLTSLRQPEPLLAEECRLLAFSGPVQSPDWLPNEVAEPLLGYKPDVNIEPDLASEMLRKVIEGAPSLVPQIEATAKHRAGELLRAHRRVRTAAKATRIEHKVEFQPPADILGVYVYLPVVK
jgi:superfamily II DNA or RNA helicase